MLYTNDAIKKRKERIIKIKNFFSMIVYIILVPLLVYNISLIVQAVIKPNETPSFLGIKTYIIISGSMKPELQIGDIVIVKEQDNFKQGDIISYRQGQSVVTHRISEVISNEDEVTYKTKGDNNNTEDSGTIGNELIEGRVISVIPFIGNIALILQDKVCIIGVIVILYIYIYQSQKTEKRRESRKNKRIEYENKKLEKQ